VTDVPHVPQFRNNKGAEDLTAILDKLDQFFSRFVAFPVEAARWAVVSWVVHTWCIDAFESTPRLAVISPEKGSGKTRTMELLELVVPTPLFTVNISAAALFRKVSSGRCTLLLDEADTYLAPKVAQNHEDLRGLVNAGHRRGAVAYRAAVGSKGGVTVEEFPAFAPCALAGIGDLPDTILDRSVLIAMKRRGPDDHVEPFRRRKVERETNELASWLQSWADQYVEMLEDAEPDMPPGIVDRPADVWEPLVIIGDHASPEWSERIRTAAVELNGARQNRDPSLGVQLLRDIRRVLTERSEDRITTEDLLEALVAVDESPWGDLRGKPLDARGLSRRLKPYEIRSTSHRFGDTTKKGYLLEDFHDAFGRYLPASGTAEHPEQSEHHDDVLAARAEEHAEHPAQRAECASPGCTIAVRQRGDRCDDHSLLRRSP
jgi:hypothetical protein